MAPAARIYIKPDDIIFNGAALSWNDESVFEMEGIKIHVNRNELHDRTVYIDFGNDIIIEIRRLMKKGTDRAVNHLNMYIDKETGISNIAGGILGKVTFYQILITDKQKLPIHISIIQLHFKSLA